MSASGQISLFREPPSYKRSHGQFFTPAWLAQKAAEWLPEGAAVLEPSCGSGNLIQAAVERGHYCVGLEIDPEWAEFCRQRFADCTLYKDRFGGKLPILTADFLTDYSLVESLVETHQITAALTNPQFEDNVHMKFVLRLLELVPVVVGIFPAGFEFSKDRDDRLWSQKGVVTMRARMPERVRYGGDQTPSFDSVCLRIERRTAPRAPGERMHVVEEVWRP